MSPPPSAAAGFATPRTARPPLAWRAFLFAGGTSCVAASAVVTLPIDRMLALALVGVALAASTLRDARARCVLYVVATALVWPTEDRARVRSTTVLHASPSPDGTRTAAFVDHGFGGADMHLVVAASPPSAFVPSPRGRGFLLSRAVRARIVWARDGGAFLLVVGGRAWGFDTWCTSRGEIPYALFDGATGAITSRHGGFLNDAFAADVARAGPLVEDVALAPASRFGGWWRCGEVPPPDDAPPIVVDDGDAGCAQ